jgi:DNA repair photolyase
LEREAAKLKGETISLSNSSDPYPQIENQAGLTRECLKILAKSNCRIQVITKSTIVTRDTEILKETHATVAMTITTDNGDIAKIIEPNAPTPTERLRTVETLAKSGIAVAVRIDPIIPFVNENHTDLITTLASLGVRHVTASTYKPRQRDWQRFAAALPEVAERLKPLYWSVGERASGCVFLPRDLRLKLLSDVRRLVLQSGMQFAVCREGLPELNTASCDGSWLLPKKSEVKHAAE